MSNFLFGYDFIDYTPTASSPDSVYPASNLKLYGHLLRHCRTVAKTQCTYTINFGAATVVKLVMLDDVNYASVYIEGSADGNNWAAFSEQYAISEDKVTKRRKLCAVLTAFNYQYLRIRIPAQNPVARFPDAALDVFRTGKLILCASTYELMYSHSWGYRRKAPKAEPQINEFSAGGREKVSMGETKLWQGSFDFKGTTLDQENELWDFDAFVDQVGRMVFFENQGDSSKCYLCQKDSSLEITDQDVSIIASNTYELKEVV